MQTLVAVGDTFSSSLCRKGIDASMRQTGLRAVILREEAWSMQVTGLVILSEPGYMSEKAQRACLLFPVTSFTLTLTAGM
jgi:hypothetical protein